jgi:prepilin-type processing-associated H-X9-DG protein
VPARRLARPAGSTGAEVFFCPSEEALPRRRRAAPGTTLSSFTYRQPPPVHPGDVPVMWDLNGGTGVAAHPKGGNVAYPDGRVLWRSADKWASGDEP